MSARPGIAIEAGALLRAHPAGVARYIECLGTAICELSGDQEAAFWYPFRRSYRWYLRSSHLQGRWYSASAPRQPPLLWHTTNCVFPRWRSQYEVATVHDLYALRDHENLAAEEKAARLEYVTRSDHVICVSHFTHRYLCDLVPGAQDRSSVIPLAVDPEFQPASEEAVFEVRQKYLLPEQFLLFMGQGRPNKNLHRLLQAHAEADASIPLVIAGKQKPDQLRVLRQLLAQLGSSEQVRFLNYVPQRLLPALLTAAQGFCFPSTFEGYGLPVREALACGTPVLTSRGVATEEAAAGHAILADPYDISSLASGIRVLIATEGRVSAPAQADIRSRTWRDVAQETLETYAHVMSR